VRCRVHVNMTEFKFTPPFILKSLNGNVVVRNLDEAVRFMVSYRSARVLHRLEGAFGEVDEREAGYAFRGWAEAERLIVK
jgi:hypothetical protein